MPLPGLPLAYLEVYNFTQLQTDPKLHFNPAKEFLTTTHVESVAANLQLIEEQNAHLKVTQVKSASGV